MPSSRSSTPEPGFRGLWPGLQGSWQGSRGSWQGVHKGGLLAEACRGKVVSASSCFTSADAAFSDCGCFRWWLRRQWQPQLPMLLFVGLNPSRADAARDDPTLRRIVGFAGAWGFGSVLVLNLFARIGPSPAVLRRCSDPVGPENDRWLRWALGPGPTGAEVTRSLDPTAIWLGWGNQGSWRGRDRQLLCLMQAESQQRPVLALGLTAAGQPRHPLYAPAATGPLLLGATHPLAQIGGPGPFCAQRAAPPWPAPPVVTPSICT